eukprot:361866-Chlamydomonas_euryale.AAC.5
MRACGHAAASTPTWKNATGIAAWRAAGRLDRLFTVALGPLAQSQRSCMPASPAGVRKSGSKWEEDRQKVWKGGRGEGGLAGLSRQTAASGHAIARPFFKLCRNAAHAHSTPLVLAPSSECALCLQQRLDRDALAPQLALPGRALQP